jgi:hypothetical protein
MKKKRKKSDLTKIFTIVIAAFTISSCSPENEETNEQTYPNQSSTKTIKIEAICEMPDTTLLAINSNSFWLQVYDGQLAGDFIEGSNISPSVANSISQNTLAHTFERTSGEDLHFEVRRYYFSVDSNTGVYDYHCSNVTINVYVNGSLFRTYTKEMGGDSVQLGPLIGSDCSDGFRTVEWFTVP